MSNQTSMRAMSQRMWFSVATFILLLPFITSGVAAQSFTVSTPLPADRMVLILMSVWPSITAEIFTALPIWAEIPQHHAFRKTSAAVRSLN